MADGDLSWLADLERSVERAAERLRELREENARLAARLAELEAATPASPPATDDPAAAAWRKQRDEVRERVESLAAGLETLLADDG